MAGRQSRPNALLHMLGPVGGVEQQLGHWLRRRLTRGVQQQLAQGGPQGSAARLPGHQQLGAGCQQATGGQPAAQSLYLGALATAIDALKHHKPAPGSHGQRRLLEISWHHPCHPAATGHLPPP